MFPPGLTQASPEGVFIQTIAEVIGDYEDYLVPESRWNDLVKALGFQSDEEGQPSGVADPTAANSTGIDTIPECQPSIGGDVTSTNPANVDASPTAVSDNVSVQPNPIPADTVSAAGAAIPLDNIALPGPTSPPPPSSVTPLSPSLSLPLAVTPPPGRPITGGKSIDLLRASGFISPKITLRIKRKFSNEDDDYVPVATNLPENNQQSSGVLPAPKKRRRRVVSSRTIADSDMDVRSRPQIRHNQYHDAEEEIEPAPVPCQRCDLNGDDCWLFPRRPRGRQRVACVRCRTIRKACSFLERAGQKQQADSRRKSEKSKAVPDRDGRNSDIDADTDGLSQLDGEGEEENEEEIVKTKGKGKAKAKPRGTTKKRALKMEEHGAEWQDGKFFFFPYCLLYLSN